MYIYIYICIMIYIYIMMCIYIYYICMICIYIYIYIYDIIIMGYPKMVVKWHSGMVYPMMFGWRTKMTCTWFFQVPQIPKKIWLFVSTSTEKRLERNCNKLWLPCFAWYVELGTKPPRPLVAWSIDPFLTLQGQSRSHDWFSSKNCWEPGIYG